MTGNQRTDYVKIYNGVGCSSQLGRIGGEQKLSLNTGCLGDIKTAVHELCHTLGFLHEHTRPDRDQWVQIIEANIQKEKLSNFRRQDLASSEGFNLQFDSETSLDTKDTPYNLESVLHYGPLDFSSNGENVFKYMFDEQESWPVQPPDDPLTIIDRIEIAMVYTDEAGCMINSTDILKYVHINRMINSMKIDKNQKVAETIRKESENIKRKVEERQTKIESLEKERKEDKLDIENLKKEMDNVKKGFLNKENVTSCANTVSQSKSKNFVVTANKTFSIAIPLNQKLAIFAVGGGGAADARNSGSSGFFQYHFSTLVSNVEITITIGAGGVEAGQDGEDTVVVLNGVETITAKGGGGKAGPGWSGGAQNMQAGSNGANGEGFTNGNGQLLPTLCANIDLSPGAAGPKHDDTGGAGGVVIFDKKPSKSFPNDGEGFGAGGGEDRHPGYDGVVVIMVCHT